MPLTPKTVNEMIKKYSDLCLCSSVIPRQRHTHLRFRGDRVRVRLRVRGDTYERENKPDDGSGLFSLLYVHTAFTERTFEYEGKRQRETARDREGEREQDEKRDEKKGRGHPLDSRGTAVCEIAPMCVQGAGERILLFPVRFAAPP